VTNGLVLFTCDLRVHDNPSLAAAVADCEQVIPAFVLDDALLAGSCGTPNRVALLRDCLADVERSLQARGAGLLLRRGDTVEQAMRLAERHRAGAIYVAADTSPHAHARRRRLAAACESERRSLHVLPGPAVVPPGALTPAGVDHYRVFTPYWRTWRMHTTGPPAPTPRRIASPPMPPARLPPGRTSTRGARSPDLIRGGETAARERLERWVASGVERYGQRRDDLAGEHTSRLGADLHFGCISPRAVLARCEQASAGEEFIRQLCWRDFHRQVLAARPDLPRRDYRPRDDRWRRDARAAEAWRHGLTGYPIVDAGMRQLRQEGYMHNRARLIVASFLTKTLYLDWRLGASHFAALLADADVANNVGNWQWVAGTGNDTRPNRVLNPLRQAQRFDPDGDYVRRHVPELAAVAGGAVHEPWRLPASLRRGLDYPAPIVDLELAARRLREHRARPRREPAARSDDG
jgi:deoxyribodipyrimidine photo-lyase